MTGAEFRQLAKTRLASLRTSLRERAAVEGMDALIDEAEQLDRAIDAFHMEGIRLRLYSLNRAISRGTPPVPDAARAALGDVKAALEAAGLHIKST